MNAKTILTLAFAGLFAATAATAALTGLPFRPPVENLRLEVAGATGSLLDLVARTDDALLVTCTWYNRTVDAQTALTTGLTRDGVYVVRGGEGITPLMAALAAAAAIAGEVSLRW